MTTAIIGLISALLGAALPIITYLVSGQRRKDQINAEIARIARRKGELTKERDIALEMDDADAITRIADEFIKLCRDENRLLQQR